jgi:hypothetical protein
LLLPCGAVFAVQTCSSPAEKLMLVHVKQSELSLFNTDTTSGGAANLAVSAAQSHQHEAITSLAKSFKHAEDAGDGVDSVVRRYEFHQPLPAGLLAVALSRCIAYCGAKTTMWRRDLVTIMDGTGSAMTMQAGPMGEWTLGRLSKHASFLGVRDSELSSAKDAVMDALQPGEDPKQLTHRAIIELIAAALQIEVSIGQRGTSQIEVKARCHAAQLQLVCLERLQLFEHAMQATIREQWPGCSTTIFCVHDDLSAGGGSPMGKKIAVPLLACEEAAARQATVVVHDGVEVPLADLAVAPFIPRGRESPSPSSDQPRIGAAVSALPVHVHPKDDTKRIVMSCPEFGTLDPSGNPPYDHDVMTKVSQLQRKGALKMGFDRAGSSNTTQSDTALFERAEQLRVAGHLAEANATLKSTIWFANYTGRAKGVMFTESQHFDGLLEILCIRGGFVTQVEAQEMEQIMREAESDAARSGVRCRFKLTTLSYFEFLAEYQSVLSGGSPSPGCGAAAEPEPEPEAEGSWVPEGVPPA